MVHIKRTQQLVAASHHRWCYGNLVKFGFLAGYGAVASVILSLYNFPRENNPSFFMRRLCAGAILFPFSRMVMQWSYYLVTRKSANTLTISALAGALCGYIFSLKGTRRRDADAPELFAAITGFAGGAILVDVLL